MKKGAATYWAKMHAVMASLFCPLSSTMIMRLFEVGVQLMMIITKAIDGSSAMGTAYDNRWIKTRVIAGITSCFVAMIPRLVRPGMARKFAPLERFDPKTSILMGTDALPMADIARNANSKGGRLPAASMSTKSALKGGQAATATPRTAPTTGGTMACFTNLRAAAKNRVISVQQWLGEGETEARPDSEDPIDASDDRALGFAWAHATGTALAPPEQHCSRSAVAPFNGLASLLRVLATSKGAISGSVAKSKSAG
mmetsp:Transcript_29177/g.88293  ORF Transcript_29177/g.88293 Transcript_29177/m.88293 type:complete len:255 (-) Transcript_29177:928-1692(-)